MAWKERHVMDERLRFVSRGRSFLVRWEIAIAVVWRILVIGHVEVGKVGPPKLSRRLVCVVRQVQRGVLGAALAQDIDVPR
jgi:hypothetical protein